MAVPTSRDKNKRAGESRRLSQFRSLIWIYCVLTILSMAASAASVGNR